MLALPLPRLFSIPWQTLLVACAMYVMLDTRFDAWLGLPVMCSLCATGLVASRWASGRLQSWMWFALGFALAVKVRSLIYLYGDWFAIQYPITLDDWLPGPNPNQWAQTLYRGQDWLFIAAFFVYASYFIVPWLFAAVTSWRRPAAFRRFAIANAIMLVVGLVVFYLLPTAPPWMASDLGYLPDVKELIKDSMGTSVPYQEGMRIAGGNPVAAMPSFHMGTIFLIFLASEKKAVPVFYVAAMAFTLVFLGHHYVCDEIAGALLAFGAWRVAK